MNICIFPFTNQWLPIPENCALTDWLEKVPDLPLELRSQFSENYAEDQILFTKWYHYCQWRLSLVIDRDRVEQQNLILRELLPPMWSFDHLRQFSAREGQIIQDRIAQIHSAVIRNGSFFCYLHKLYINFL